MKPYVSTALIAHLTDTFRDALSMRQSDQTLSVDHEGMVMSGAAERYVFSTDDGSITVDFAPLTDGRVGVDRLQVETTPDLFQEANFGTLLETRLEVFHDSQVLGWDCRDSAERVLTASRLLDLYHVMSRANQQMRDTAQYLRAMATDSARDIHEAA